MRRIFELRFQSHWYLSNTWKLLWGDRYIKMFAQVKGLLWFSHVTKLLQVTSDAFTVTLRWSRSAAVPRSRHCWPEDLVDDRDLGVSESILRPRKSRAKPLTDRSELCPDLTFCIFWQTFLIRLMRRWTQVHKFLLHVCYFLVPGFEPMIFFAHFPFHYQLLFPYT